MRAPILTPELIQRNVQRLVRESALSLRGLAVTSGIPMESLRRKLAGEECLLTVAELASITRALGYKIEAVFEDQPDMRPCSIPECVEAEHEWANGAQLNPCQLKSIDGAGFIVHGDRLEDGWTAWADADDLADAHEGIAQARALVEAFAAMQARCDKLNEAVAA